MRTALSSIAVKTGSSSPGDLLIICSTSEVAVNCSSASSRSRVRWSRCSCRSEADMCEVAALRALRPPRRTFAGRPLPLRRCMSPPLAGHDDAKSYAKFSKAKLCPSHPRKQILLDAGCGVSTARFGLSPTPEVLELRRRQLGVPDRVLDRFMPEVVLNAARIVAGIGQGVAAGMPQHV